MRVSPSFLSCDFSKLKAEILSVNTAPWLHFDVMDGVFVEAKTYDHHLLKEVKTYSNQFFDCHLMVENPIDLIKDYAASHADLITFHYESNPDLVQKTIDEIKKYKIQVGISVKPSTSIEVIFPFLSSVDLVLVMSVEPGKGGQKFIVESLEKIKLLKQLRESLGYHYLIEVDGGINQDTVSEVKEAGVDVVVVGSYLFNNSDRKLLIEQLENE